MHTIILIAAMDEKNGIGKDNKLLCHLPADLKHFKTMTYGKSIIMGKNTFLSIGKPLPGRQNIVLSHQCIDDVGITWAKNLNDALMQVSMKGPVFIIGGAQVFQETIKKAEEIYITRIHHEFSANTFFPNLDEAIWACISTTERCADEKNAYDMTFCHYKRRTVKK